MSHFASLQAKAASALVGAALLVGSASAQAFDLSDLSLVFAEPTGTALATDDIVVNVTMSLSANALESFTFDANAGAPFALPDGVLPTEENGVPFVSYDAAYLSTWFGCSGTFTDNACPSGTTTYDFQWAQLADQMTLAPGESITFSIGSFTPNGGAAPAGHYEFFYASVAVFATGLGPNDEPLWAWTDLANTSASNSVFARDVTAVPEPGTWALMLAGLGITGAAARSARRRRQAA